MIKLHFDNETIKDFVKNKYIYILESEIRYIDKRLMRLENVKFFDKIFHKNEIKDEKDRYMKLRDGYSEIIKKIKNTSDSRKLFEIWEGADDLYWSNEMDNSFEIMYRRQMGVKSGFEDPYGYENLLLLDFVNVLNLKINSTDRTLAIKYLLDDNKEVCNAYVHISGICENAEKEGLTIEDGALCYYKKCSKTKNFEYVRG